MTNQPPQNNEAYRPWAELGLIHNNIQPPIPTNPLRRAYCPMLHARVRVHLAAHTAQTLRANIAAHIAQTRAHLNCCVICVTAPTYWQQLK